MATACNVHWCGKLMHHFPDTRMMRCPAIRRSAQTHTSARKLSLTQARAVCGGLRRLTIAGLAADALQLLDHGVEQLPSLQLVFAGPAPPATGGRCVQEAHHGRQRFAQLAVQQLDLPSLVGLQLRDLLHVPEKSTGHTRLYWRTHSEHRGSVQGRGSHSHTRMRRAQVIQGSQ